MTKQTSPSTQPRGPTDHEVRAQIVDAATEYFGLYGYEKTTVSDLAKAIDFSKAYIYKFFDSKQAIGEVICANRLAEIISAVDTSMADAQAATEKFRRMFRAFVANITAMFFDDRKLYDMATVAAAAPWPSVRNFEVQIRLRVNAVLAQGRESGEFERKTPMDEASNAIFLVMKPYINPLLLQYNLDGVDDATTQLTNLVLRSLAP